jgi:hypothetical protein
VRPVERSIVGPILSTRSTMSSVVASQSAAGLGASAQASQFGRTDDALIGEALADHCEDIELPRREWIAGAVANYPVPLGMWFAFRSESISLPDIETF